MDKIKTIPWTVFIAECADGEYYASMTRNLKKLMTVSNVLRLNGHLRPEKLPIKIIFKEENLFFREAWAKWQYLREMNRRLRERLVRTGKWPIGGKLREYIEKTPEEML